MKYYSILKYAYVSILVFWIFSEANASFLDFKLGFSDNLEQLRHRKPTKNSRLREQHQQRWDLRCMETPDPYLRSKTFWQNELARTDRHFCGLAPQSLGKYSSLILKTFENKTTLYKQGFELTHMGACGTCSSLQDLDVYLNSKDLTRSVRKCGLLTFRRGIMQCLKNIGFSRHCAETWYYNIVHTRRRCPKVCFKSWAIQEPYNLSNGNLNPCLQCDEDESGPAFKVSAGRTRRRSGIVAEIIRPKEETFDLSHEYLPSFASKGT